MMEPNELPSKRIADVFPFPVKGHDASSFLAENPEGFILIGLVPFEDPVLEVRPLFQGAKYPPSIRGFIAGDGSKWVLVYSDDTETMVKLTKGKPEESDYAPGDRVYSKRNPHLPYLFGTVVALCPRPIVSPFQCVVVAWEGDLGGPQTEPIKDIALVNNFTPHRAVEKESSP